MLEDSKRLSKNQKTLLESMPEAVILANVNGEVQQANPEGLIFLQQTEPLINNQKIEIFFSQLIRPHIDDKATLEPQRLQLGQRWYSVHLADFSGYTGEKLFWIIAKEVQNATDLQIDSTAKNDSPLIIGSCNAIKRLRESITTVASADATVMISGESGTGKELVAKLLHQHSKRNDHPLLTINCSSLNDTLLESELFGYEKGAFTGADSRRIGKVETCNGGTIFLDEIADISPRMQGMLLRVLQNGEIIRVGGSSTTKVDVRVIAATNRDLAEDVQSGRFRIDLFYRLNIIKLPVPPLRERGDDIVELAYFFVRKYANIIKKDVKISASALTRLQQPYSWPGNVRELENVIHRATLLCKSDTIEADDLSFDFPRPNSQPFLTYPLTKTIENFNETPLKNILNHVEKEIIISKLKKNGGNVADTAAKLSICKAALYEKMRRLDISAKGLR